jgi:hypothetical protein
MLLRFPPDLLLVFELSGALALDSFDTDFMRVGIRLTFDTGVPPTDFLAFELTNGAFLLVTNAWKFNHMFTTYRNNQKYTIYNCLVFPAHITQFCKRKEPHFRSMTG